MICVICPEHFFRRSITIFDCKCIGRWVVVNRITVFTCCGERSYWRICYKIMCSIHILFRVLIFGKLFSILRPVSIRIVYRLRFLGFSPNLSIIRFTTNRNCPNAKTSSSRKRLAIFVKQHPGPGNVINFWEAIAMLFLKLFHIMARAERVILNRILPGTHPCPASWHRIRCYPARQCGRHRALRAYRLLLTLCQVAKTGQRITAAAPALTLKGTG